jgi:transcriptional regulator with XRE-family HTH domain
VSQTEHAELLEEVDARRAIVDALGTPEERRLLRERLGLTISDVAKACGLSYYAVWLREQPRWKHQRGSLDSEAGLKYAEFVARTRGVDLFTDSTIVEGRDRAGPQTS